MSSKLILASGSVARQEFLRTLGVDFIAAPMDVDETARARESARGYLKRVVLLKVAAAAKKYPNAPILAADTIVSVAGKLLQKPADAEEMRYWCKLYSGRKHACITGVALQRPDGKHKLLINTTVIKIKKLTQAEIEFHVANEHQWRGIGGGYKLQSATTLKLVEWIYGSPSGVMGLPLVETISLLNWSGVKVD